jgi:hypothetical protein
MHLIIDAASARHKAPSEHGMQQQTGLAIRRVTADS